MIPELTADLLRQQANYARLVGEASALGTKPEARAAWELVHEQAGIIAKTRSRLQQQRWAA